MKLIFILFSILLLQINDCDNKTIASNIFLGLDITKTNDELIAQLKLDTNYSQTKIKQTVPGTTYKQTFVDFKFLNHSLINKGGRIQFQSKKHEDGRTDIVLYFVFNNKVESDKAFSIIVNEIKKGCFKEEVIITDDSYAYTVDNIRIYLSRDLFVSDKEVTVLISRK
jgi:hypothetical protein